MVLADDMGSYRRDQTLRGVILALSSASQSASAPQTQRALEQVEVFREFLAFFAKVAQTEVTLLVVVVVCWCHLVWKGYLDLLIA